MRALEIIQTIFTWISNIVERTDTTIVLAVLFAFLTAFLVPFGSSLYDSLNRIKLALIEILESRARTKKAEADIAEAEATRKKIEVEAEKQKIQNDLGIYID